MGAAFSRGGAGAALVAQLAPYVTQTIQHLLDLIYKKPPEQSCPVDASILEYAKKVLDDKEIELAKRNEQLELEKAKLDARSASRYKEREPTELKILRQHALKKLGLDSVNKINICITGDSGVGKSSLINGLRGLDPDDPEAAKVDVNECTTSLTQYPHPKADHVILWDCPGGDTLDHPRETYFFDNYLYAFDYLVIVFTGRFGAGEIDLIKQAIAHHVPFVLLRNKANQDFEAKRTTNRQFKALEEEEAIKQLIREHRDKTIEQLRKAMIESHKVNIFVVNVHWFNYEQQLKFEEPQLVEHLIEVIGKRRYGTLGK